MTALNWERNRSNQKTKDFAPDSPPLTGSLADQARYGVRLGRMHSVARGSSEGIVRNRQQDFSRLQSYVQTVRHPDFRRKTQAQRTEILKGLKVLVGHCETWGAMATMEDVNLIKAAWNLLQKDAGTCAFTSG